MYLLVCKLPGFCLTSRSVTAIITSQEVEDENGAEKKF
jgi:hypothetical protein